MPLKKGRVASDAETPAPRGTQDLLVDLRSDDAEARRTAAVVLEGRPEANEAIAELIQDESDPRVAFAMIISLLKTPNPKVAEKIFDLVRQDDASRRTLAVDALRSMPTEYTSFLRQGLDDDDEDVRILTVNTLQQVRGDGLEELLVARLEVEDNANVVGAIVEALFEVGTSASVPALKAAAERFGEEDFIKFAIHEVVSQLENRGRG